MLTIKVSLADSTDLRRFSVDPQTNFEQLVTKLEKDIFPNQVPLFPTYTLKYTDDEGDLTTLTSDAELQCAFSLAASLVPPILRLSLIKNPEQKQPAAAAPAPLPAAAPAPVAQDAQGCARFRGKNGCKKWSSCKQKFIAYFLILAICYYYRWTMWSTLIAVGVLSWLLAKPKSQAGMAPEAGPRMKIFFAWLMIQFGNRFRKRNSIVSDDAIDQRIPDNAKKVDPNYNDSFVFQGHETTKGEAGALFVSRLGFRGSGVTEAWVMLLGGDFAQEYGHLIISNSECKEESKTLIHGNGLKFVCIQPGKQWKISFDGIMNSEKKGAVKVKFDLTWEATAEMYHSAKHMDPWAIATAMSSMPWSRGYFKSLKREHQARIEQGGVIYGEIQVGGPQPIPLLMSGLRDHSWGRRNWLTINRYVWSLVSFTQPFVIKQDAPGFTFMSFMVASYGNIFKQIVGGWIASEREVLPIVSATSLDKIGADGVIPDNFTVKFQPKGCRVVTMVVQHLSGHSWLVNKDTFEVREHNAKVTCSLNPEANIVTGFGVMEFGYSNNTPRKNHQPKLLSQ